MRGSVCQSGSKFCYVDLDSQVPQSHPLSVIRRIGDKLPVGMSGGFDATCAPLGQPSVPTERVLRALLRQAFYTIRSGRQPVEGLDFDQSFRWFVGGDGPVWGEGCPDIRPGDGFQP